MKTIPSTVPNHCHNTTHLVLMGVLGYSMQVYRLFTECAPFRHLIILVMVWSD